MIRIEPPPEPVTFDAECRQPGTTWLAGHPDGDPPCRFWRPYILELCRGFGYRCGYSAMWDLNGTIDHYLSREKYRNLAFEWTNFRYVSGWLNSSKQTLDQQVLDPFQVRDEWFEIVLPSLIMRLTPAIPNTIRPRAEYTLRRLHLIDGDRIYAQRQIYYSAFMDDKRPIAWLEDCAPILATAVRRERVRDELAIRATASIDEIRAICDTTREHARRLVRCWVSAGHLQVIGRGRGVRYRRV